jgi:uncharacterized protein (TIGR00730 family)
MTARELTHVCLFCGSNVGARPAYAEAARALGRTLAAEQVALVYGGGSVGLMHEAAEAALASGGNVIGVITEALMAREVGHGGLTAMHVVRTMHERKAMMASLADAFVALPGGYGTFDELCEMLTWDQLGIHEKPAVLVNIDGYFDGFLAQLERAVADGLVKPEHRALLSVVTTIADVLPAARAWTPPAASKWYRDRPPSP